ncbi:N-terminal amidase [Colletotrichum asianum]
MLSSQINKLDDPNFPTTEIGKPSYVLLLTETIETISPDSWPPSTPFFEPKTPKAMAIVLLDSDDSNGAFLSQICFPFSLI